MLISSEGQSGLAAAASHVKTATEMWKWKMHTGSGKWDQNSNVRDLLTEAIIVKPGVIRQIKNPPESQYRPFQHSFK